MKPIEKNAQNSVRFIGFTKIPAMRVLLKGMVLFMTKIDIFSGFLGAGKTTLIKKLISEAYAGEKLVLIENEFGEIGIVGGFLRDADIAVTEMNSGCICCSLVGDFSEALGKVLEQFHPDRILIEPSGVGKLSDVIRAVRQVHAADAVLNSFTTVVDANRCKMYMRNFGEFFNDQVEHAGAIVLSHTDAMSQEKLTKCVELLRERNADATLVTTPWSELTGAQLLDAMERKNTVAHALEKLAEETAHEHHHDHDHHDHDHHDHDHDHHHEHEHDHEHDHEHHVVDEHGHCSCGHDHHHHDADEVFVSWGVETARKYTREELQGMLEQLLRETEYGSVLRAKGIVPAKDGTWLHFDYVPGEPDVRTGGADVTGRLCVIGADLKQDKLAQLFEVS